MTSTIEIRKNDVLEIKCLDKWRSYKRLWTRKDIREAQEILNDPNCLCGWRIMRDGMEVGL